ncbi:hypothetical protein [uncultured Pseudoteredinibacter sp.]|uniref:hypothetical protein n=1 Tax=uncultured Pseudoteredinibacter sp. TaxID=1641701 RepID=UPI00261CFB4E|nr:hypothetical protein [uncultured Pseudoteredinibacter sp.]
MSKTLHISATITIVCLLVMRVVPYYEGLAFDKFWSIPMGVLPVGLIAFFTFIVSAISCLIAVVKKQKSLNHLIVMGLLPILVVAIYKFPFPSYIDGMHKTVQDALPLDEIVKLSIEAREINPKWTNYEEHDKLIEKLRTKYPNALNLSHTPPRIGVSDNHVSVFYGSALVKHWGYLFTESDSFPIEHIPEGMYKQVYKGVWVYHDIW